MKSMPWKTYLAASGVFGTGGGTVLAAMTGTPTWMITTGAAAACVACAKIVPHVLARSPALDHLDKDTRAAAARVWPLAPAAHATWVAGALLVDAPVQWGALLVGLGIAEYGVARGIEYKATLHRQAEQQEQHHAAAIEAGRAAPAHADTPTRSDGLTVVTDPHAQTRGMQQVLTRAGLGYVTVISWKPIGPEDETLGLQFRVKVPASASKRTGGAPRLSMNNAESIAIALSEETGLEVGSSWVQVTKLPAAGTYTVTVTTSDTMSRIYPYRIDTRPVSIHDPALIGYGIDGMPQYEKLTQHWADTGETRSGKTSLIQVKRVHTLRAYDAVLWVGGTEKLYDSVGPLLDPYIGTGIRPPIDAVASGRTDTLNMLLTVMLLARWRQSVPHALRGGFKTIIVEVDEASFFLALQRITVDYGGEKVTPSQMAENIIKGAGSAGIWIHLASQRGTNDNWGESGGTINANLHVQTVFRTGDSAEIGRAFDDWTIPVPTHKGEYLIRGEDGAVRRLRAPYIQETDPSKPTLHDGPNLSDVAWSLRGMYSGLDPESVQALNQMANGWYAKRPQTAEAIYHYLTGLDPNLEFTRTSTNVTDSDVPEGGRVGHNAGPDRHLASVPNSGTRTQGTGEPDAPGGQGGTGREPEPTRGSREPAKEPEPASGTDTPNIGNPTREPAGTGTGNQGTGEGTRREPGTDQAGNWEPAPTAASSLARFPVPGTGDMAGTVENLADPEEQAYELTLTLLERLVAADDTDGLERLAKVDTLDGLLAFEETLSTEPAPVREPVLTAPTPAMPSFPPMPSPFAVTWEQAADTGAVAGAVAVQDRAPLIERVERVIWDAPGTIPRREIIQQVMDGEGRDVPSSYEQLVSNALRSLTRQGRAIRTGDGYTRPDTHSQITNTQTNTG